LEKIQYILYYEDLPVYLYASWRTST